jgi:membrane protein implicated in regulation of membrane protease activity
LIGEVAQVQSFEVSSLEKDDFYVFLQSERWSILCQQQLKVDDKVKVIAVDGVVLEVEKI